MSASPLRSHFRQCYSAEHHELMREINQSAQWTRENNGAAAGADKAGLLSCGTETQNIHRDLQQRPLLGQRPAEDGP